MIGRPRLLENTMLLDQCKKAALELDSDCCFIIAPARSQQGRPMVNHVFGKTSMTASRYVWILANGDPKGLSVLHNCPTGADDWCINPRHLYLGTQQNNMQDMVDAGWPTIGEGSPNSKLTWDDVEDIRRLGSTQMTYSDIAEIYGVNLITIHDVVKNKTWKDNNYNPPTRKVRRPVSESRRIKKEGTS